MNDAKPMSRDQLRHRREQGQRLHMNAKTLGSGGIYPETVLRAWQSFDERFEARSFLRRRQAS